MSERKRMRIVSDGNISGTRVIDLETGKALPTAWVEWHACWRDNESGLAGPPTATVKVLFAEVDVETGAEVITVCPECGKGAAIKELRRLRAEVGALRDHVERLERGRRA
jgi:hypothetical protein